MDRTQRTARMPARPRAERGAANRRGGEMAEEAVALHYMGRGCRVLARRWRSVAGEIDLVVQDGETVVAVEVKRASTHDTAALRLSPRQRARLCAALALFCEGQDAAGAPDGRRFDLALVDGMGRVELYPNAWGEDW